MKRKRNNVQRETRDANHRRRKMQDLRILETATTQGFLKQLLEEKMEAFGFTPDEMILDISWDLPEHIPLKIKFKKEQEAKVIHHNAPT